MDKPKPPERKRDGTSLCGECLTVMLQQRPPGRLMYCVNDKCPQRHALFHT